MKAVISRRYGNTSTRGRLVIFDGELLVSQFVTLELPDNGNQVNVSCIPEGRYDVAKIYSPRFGKCFHVLDVEGRIGILIHAGNYTRQTRGCILPGMSFYDIDADGVTDVIESMRALSRMLEILPEKFELHII